MPPVPRFLLLLLLGPFLFGAGALAQTTGVLTGTVVEEGTERPMPGVGVAVGGTRGRTLTDAGGRFTIGALPPGAYTVQALAPGYLVATARVDVRAGDTTTVRLRLRPRPADMLAPVIEALDPDLVAVDRLDGRRIAEHAVTDTGEALRLVPGLDARRRGGLGFDPLVRALAETEVGVIVDGARFFAATPVRADAQTSHLDPSAVADVEVVKGPYALTWGAGLMSAVRIRTLAATTPPERLRATVQTGYASNRNAFESSAALAGSSRKYTYGFHGAYREGGDYEAGDGATVPGGFRSWALRGRGGYRPSERSEVSVIAGFQKQTGLDVPGRTLDVEDGEAKDVTARYRFTSDDAVLRAFDLVVYWNRITSAMNNDRRPTARVDLFRDPPFALRIDLDAAVTTTGGRAAARIVSDDGLTLDVGADYYRKKRNADRTVHDRSGGALLSADTIFAGVRISDIGLFLRGTTLLHGFKLSAATRFDFVQADADGAGVFYLQNAARRPLNPDNLDRKGTNLSLAFTVARPLSAAWTLAAGLGSVARTADALERYADRFPSTRSNTNAEVLGRPEQEPERASELDLSLTGAYPRLRVRLNVFARLMSDYTTFLPTDLPARADTSARIFRYRNGEGRFWGGEATATYTFASIPLTLDAAFAYLWGKDVTLDEPAFGVSPAAAGLRLRYDAPGGVLFAEGALHHVARQTRVAALRGERPTDGYTTADLRFGVRLPHAEGDVFRTASLLFGVDNVTDTFYARHVNALDPFDVTPLPEPGRVFFARLRLEL
jgi:iron complex outermembrane receptor protein